MPLHSQSVSSHFEATKAAFFGHVPGATSTCHEFHAKMQALLTHMHASQRAQAQQNARWPASANPMNAMFTCVVLQPLPAKAMRQELEANPAAAKEHAGTRFVGYVLHGEPGWTSTGGAADAASGKERGAKKAAAATAPVRGEKLSRQAGEAVLMHSYDLKNKVRYAFTMLCTRLERANHRKTGRELLQGQALRAVFRHCARHDPLRAHLRRPAAQGA